jgi:hypothetical protein
LFKSPESGARWQAEIASLDHLVDSHQDRLRDGEAKRFCDLEVDDRRVSMG